MSIGQHILEIPVQNSSQNLAVNLILAVDFRVFLVNSEQLDHVESSFAFVERPRKSIESFIMVFSGKNRQISVKHLNDKLGNVCSFSFFLLRFLDYERQNSIEGLEEISWIKDHFCDFVFARRRFYFWRRGSRSFFFKWSLFLIGGRRFHEEGQSITIFINAKLFLRDNK